MTDPAIVPLDPTRAATLSNRLQLQNLFVAAMTARIAAATQVSTTLAFDISRVNAQWALASTELLSVVMPFGLVIRDEKSTSPLAQIAVVFRLDYSINESAEAIDEDAIHHYVGVTGFLHAWPYFRAEVQTLTTKMGFPALTLPVAMAGNAIDLVNVKRAPLQETAAPTPTNTTVSENPPPSKE